MSVHVVACSKLELRLSATTERISRLPLYTVCDCCVRQQHILGVLEISQMQTNVSTGSRELKYCGTGQNSNKCTSVLTTAQLL